MRTASPFLSGKQKSGKEKTKEPSFNAVRMFVSGKGQGRFSKDTRFVADHPSA